MIDKPKPIWPTVELVPPELRELPRWVGFRFELKENRWTKVPYSTRTGTPIGVTPIGSKGQPWHKEWYPFAIALAGAKKLNLDGVGFVFVEGDGYYGVDFDNCRNPETGEIREVASIWLEHLATYSEASVSGTGTHAIGKGVVPSNGHKQPMPDDILVKCEIYDRARFFTFTGYRLADAPLALRASQPEINALHYHVFGDTRATEPGEESLPSAAREFFTDERIVARITAAKKWAGIFDKGNKASTFVAEHYKGDDSSADLAFATFVARYTTSPAQVERLWKKSILWREKSATRADYRGSTIDAAFKTAQQAQAHLVDTNDRVEVTWLWQDRFPRGKLIMIDGDPGLSKSMFTLAVAVSVMTGKPFLDGTKPATTGGVVLLSAEDDLRDTINPRLLAAGSPSGIIPMIHLGATKPDGSQFSLADPNDRLELEIMIARIDAQLVIIDPLNAYLGEKVDSHNDQKIRQVLGPLSEIANRTGTTILALRHLSKSGGNKALYRGMGSIGYTAAARANFFVAEHPEEKETFVFAASKFNLGPKPASLQYKLAFATVQGIKKAVPYVANGTACALSANDLAAAQTEEADGGGKLSDAVYFLQQLLKEKPVAETVVKRLAREADISDRTLRRAKDKLGVVSEKKGKVWLWALKTEETEKTEPAF